MKKQKFIYILIAVMIFAAVSFGGQAITALATSIDDIDAEANASDNPLEVYRQKQKELRENMEAYEKAIKDQQNLIIGYEEQIKQLDIELTNANAQLLLVQEAITATQAIIDQLELDILDAEARLAERLELLKSRLVNVYVNGNLSILDVVFETTSFEDFVTLYDMVELIVMQDRSLADQIVAEREAIEADKQEQLARMDELTELEKEQHDVIADLKAKEQEKAALIDEAEMTKAEYEQMYASELATAEAASEKIRELLANSDSTLTYGGAMMWPLPSPYGKDYVTSPYGWRTHPVYGDQRFHTGIDIGAPGGTPIFAAADGKIILREYYGGYGNCIMIDHGSGVVSLYAHQSGYGSFSVGDYVMAGDTIGYVGTTGTSTGNHLHFETRNNGNYTSPWDYLQ